MWVPPSLISFPHPKLTLALRVDSTIILSGVTTFTVVASASFACSAVFSSVVLYDTHCGDCLATSPNVVSSELLFSNENLITLFPFQAAYIMRVEDASHGLRPLSLVLSLPRTLTSYAILSLAAGIILQILRGAYDGHITIPMATACVLPIAYTLSLIRLL